MPGSANGITRKTGNQDKGIRFGKMHPTVAPCKKVIPERRMSSVSLPFEKLRVPRSEGTRSPKRYWAGLYLLGS